MNKRLTSAEINAVLRYCLAHCDSDKETEVVQWVGEKLAQQQRRKT